MNEQSVLITGSGRGIGKELALHFAGFAWKTVIHDRDEKELFQVKDMILKLGKECLTVTGDLRETAMLEKLTEAAEGAGVSVLVNNAAIGLKEDLDKVADEQIDELIMTNLTAAIKLTKRIYAYFLKRGKGTIINMVSLSGLNAQEGRTVYCASKWGLRGFTETLRLEAEKNNIRVLGIYPSRVKTRPEFTYGLEVKEVVSKIYEAYLDPTVKELIMDGRPKQ